MTEREPRVRRGRLLVAVLCGVGAASLVVYLAALELTMQSAFAWLALFGLFEVVFAVTVTLISTWDATTRSHRLVASVATRCLSARTADATSVGQERA